MKKLITIAMLLLLVTGCAQQTQSNETTSQTGLANPWSESSLSALESVLGTTIGLPDGASVDNCRLLEEEGLAEIDLTLNGMSYTYRLKAADAAEDISGLYYEWATEDDVTIAGLPGSAKRATDGDETIDLVEWYDAAKGIQHALTTSGADLDGFDITAIANLFD